MIRLHFSMTCHHDPVCPVCLHPLVGNVFKVRHNIAFCVHCFDSPLEAIRQARISVRWVHRHFHNPSQWVTANGIFVYVGTQPLGMFAVHLNEYAHACDPSL